MGDWQLLQVGVNALLYLTLMATGARTWRRARTDGVRLLGAAVAVVSLVVALGATQRGLLVLTQRGLLPPGVGTFLQGPWQLLQAAIGTLGAIVLLVVLRRHADAFEEDGALVDRLGRDLLDRPGLEAAGLTRREREVVDLMRSGLLADAELADALTISPATAGTHVRNIMRKLEVHDRRDVVLVGRSSAAG